MNTSKSHFPFGIPKLPARYASIVMPLILSVLMTCVVSMISTIRGVGLGQNFLKVWPSAWALSWVIAFPVLLMVLPIVRRITALVIRAA